jgi:hypothetical protein
MDALNDTVFSDVPGKDGAVVWLEVIKLKGETSDDAKLWIMIESLPAKVVTKKGADEYYLGPLYRAQVKKK